MVVVGGGISGLATAHYLRAGGAGDRPIRVIVLEAGSRAGGKLWTIDVDGMPLEAGADSFVVRKPWAVDLCRELGLEDRVIVPGAMGAFVWTRRGLVAYPERAPFGIPADLDDLLRWRGLRRGPKIRALADFFRRPRKGEDDESLGGLLRRRLGLGVASGMVEPLLAGLHAGDPLDLSVLATFPELRGWERQHGSLLRGARAAARATREEQGRQPMFATLWGGLGGLVERLVHSVSPDSVALDTPVSELGADGGRLWLASGRARFEPDAVVLATPAFESARLLGGSNPEAAGELSSIPYVSTSTVHLVYPEGTAARLPEGTGFVVPAGRGTITACTWMSRKWPHPSFGQRAVLRCFVGRAGDESALSLSDPELAAMAAREAARALDLGSEPERTRVVRWNRAMPQYRVGHLDLLARLDGALAATPGVFVTGSAYRGVGIADCVRQAKETAERVAAHLEQGRAAEQEVISWTS